jgi:hypothetical protein
LSTSQISATAERIMQMTRQSQSAPRRLVNVAVGIAALATAGSAVMIAVEQRHQTDETRKTGCYSRASAAAAVAATEIATTGSSKTNAALTFVKCDQTAGIAP